ncbi:MAG TPA: hypothetical protein VMU51_38630 [Mycobacteriales bacterium]|nr:hypothetical protein [Mycobacteriales bacterium]
MTDDADRGLIRRLRQMWQTADPERADLADRILFALQLEDADVELLRLGETVRLAGVRGADVARTVTFSNSSLSVLVTMSEPAPGQRRLDGYIVPAAALRVELCSACEPRHATASPTGRFAFSDVPTGLLQLVFHPTAGAAVDLDRPFLTPPVQL